MLLLVQAAIFIFLIFAAQEVNSERRRDSCENIHGNRKCEAEKDERWSYGLGNGPESWGNISRLCNGENQSPINIDTKSAEEADFEPMQFFGFEKPITNGTIRNNGHTVVVTPTDGTERYISSGGLPQPYPYDLVQLHFHWGGSKGYGSEHSMDKKTYDMEMHLVHANNESKLAVVAVFFTISKRKDAINKALVPLVTKLDSVKYQNDSTNLESLTLSALLPKSLDCLCRYEGSLTTPDCGEGVTWTILRDTLHIGKKQMKEFRKLYTTSRDKKAEECHMVNNFRCVQPVNNRTIMCRTE